MKAVLFATTVIIAALASAPASSQSGQGPAGGEYILPPSGNFIQNENPAFRAPRFAFPRCFDGDDIAGVNRNGDTLYVQSRYPRTREPGRIFSMKLAESCDGLDATKAIKLRSNQGGVCEGSAAWVQVNSPAGSKSCKLKNVRVLTRHEVAALAAPTRR